MFVAFVKRLFFFNLYFLKFGIEDEKKDVRKYSC